MTIQHEGFAITGGRGFHIRFKNGWTVSVQFGGGNYGSNYDLPVMGPTPPATTAEIAAWDSGGNWYDFGGDTVDGYKTADEVLAIMNMIAAK